MPWSEFDYQASMSNSVCIDPDAYAYDYPGYENVEGPGFVEGTTMKCLDVEPTTVPATTEPTTEPATTEPATEPATPPPVACDKTELMENKLVGDGSFTCFTITKCEVTCNSGRRRKGPSRATCLSKDKRGKTKGVWYTKHDKTITCS